MVTTGTEAGAPPGPASFRANFWNADMGNFTGFEVLVSRLKAGRAVCKEYTEFLRQRSLIEEQYGKALVKLAKAAGGREEISLVRPAWDSLRTHTEMVGLNHVQAGNQLVSEVGRILEQVDSGRERRKWAEESVRSLQVQVKAAHKRNTESRRAYELRCREEIQASHQYHQEAARAGLESSGAERAQARHAKARQAMEAAEEGCRAAAEGLEDTRGGWRRETEGCADTFQQLEAARLQLLRDSAWRVTNVGSGCCVQDDELWEETRKVLESCDLEEGLQQFIQQHETGTEAPGEVVWEPLPNSSSLGMGHMGQGRTGPVRRPGEWDTYSLGRPELVQQSLADAGRSRSDLGFTNHSLSQSQASLHRQQTKPVAEPGSLPPARPRKPPRLLQYTQSHIQQAGDPKARPAPPRSVSITSVENTEYYHLPAEQQLPAEQLASSDYNSSESADCSPASASPPNRQSPPSKPGGEGLSPRRPPAYPGGPGYTLHPGGRRRAVVLCEYRRKNISEVSLSKNSVVTVLEGAAAMEWWRVESDQGIQGFYPASFLRQVN